jgi:hypothetical protein
VRTDQKVKAKRRRKKRPLKKLRKKKHQRDLEVFFQEWAMTSHTPQLRFALLQVERAALPSN